MSRRAPRRSCGRAQVLALTCLSGQNVERFMTFYQAAVRSERTFVIDAYMANLIDALSLAALPDVRADLSLRVYLPRSQRRMIIAGKRFDLIDRFGSRRIYPEAAGSAAAVRDDEQEL